MSPVTIIIIVAILGCFVTQFFSNSATAILFLTALAPLAVSLYQQGVNVSVLPPIIGIGTLTATMLPYSLCFLVFWSLLLVAWLLLGWPIGPGAGIRL